MKRAETSLEKAHEVLHGVGRPCEDKAETEKTWPQAEEAGSHQELREAGRTCPEPPGSGPVDTPVCGSDLQDSERTDSWGLKPICSLCYGSPGTPS